MPLKGCLRDAEQHFFNCPLSKNSIVVLDRSQYHQPWIDVQWFGSDVEVRSPREVYIGWAAQIALATRCGTSIAGQVVHQVGTPAATLAPAQVDVLQHRLQPLLEACISTGEALLDSVQIRAVS